MRKIKSLLLLILFPTLLFSQELPRDKKFIKDKYNIKLNYGLHNLKDYYYHSVNIEANYGFLEWLDAGVFFDYIIPLDGLINRDWDSLTIHYDANGELLAYRFEGGTSTWFKYNIFNYGLNANIHILPLFINPNYSFVDVYINPKIGMRTEYAKEIEYRVNEFYYSIGAGVGINFTRKFGLMCEYNYSRPLLSTPREYYNYPEEISSDHRQKVTTGHSMRFGINIRF